MSEPGGTLRAVRTRAVRSRDVASGTDVRAAAGDGPDRVDRGPRVLREFPVTTLVAMPYAILILPQALLFANPDTGFIVWVLFLTLLPAFVVEVLTRHRSVRPLSLQGPSYGRNLYRLAVVLGVVGSLSTVVRALAGVGSVSAQVTGASGGSLLTTALSVLTPWSVISVGLLVAAHLAGECTRRRMFAWIGVVVLGQAVAAHLNAITAPFFVFAIFVTTLLLYVGLVGIRHCVAIGAVILVVWPTVFALRNEARTAAGVDVSVRVGAFDRLRYDLQITRAVDLGHSIDVATPDLIGILRYGLIPRFLDPGRPSLSTGNLINVYLGGVAESSFTFLPVTTTYVLEGPLVAAGVYVGWVVLLFLLLRHGRRVTPLRLAVLALVLAGPLSWFATYPDDTIGLLQGTVSLAPVAVALHLLRRRAHTPAATAGGPDADGTGAVVHRGGRTSPPGRGDPVRKSSTARSVSASRRHRL